MSSSADVVVADLGSGNLRSVEKALAAVGARVSIVVGFAAAVISAVLGAAVGLIGGYFGGLTDKTFDAFENWFLVIPQIPLMIVLARLLSPSLFVLIAVIGFTSWAGTARVVRAQVLTLKERPFVERARALGASDSYVLRVHVLPNTLPLISGSYAMSAPAFDVRSRTVWYTDGDSGFYAVRLTNGSWPTTLR